MSNLGAYQLMTTAAKEMGGPELMIETIKKAAYNNGARDMKNKIVAPLILGGICLGVVGTYVYQKAKIFIDEKRFAEEKLAEEAVIKEAMIEDILQKELEQKMKEEKSTI